MDKTEFEKQLIEKLEGIRKLSEKFFADNPEYDVDGKGYVSLVIYRDGVMANTDPARKNYVSVYKSLELDRA